MNSLELKDAIHCAVVECRNIVETCKTELRELTDDEKTRIDELKKDIEEKKSQLKALEEELNAIELPNEELEEKNISEEKEMEKKSFSLLRTVRSIVNNQTLDSVDAAVINAGAEEMRKAGVSFAGQIQLPTENRAAITVAAEGTDVVATDIFDILEPLRAKNVLVNAGAKFMTGLVGDVQVPVMSASNVTWEGETSDAKDGAGAFTNVKLSPKRLTAYIDISKQFLAQDSVGAEAVIRQDLINAINSKLEATILGDAAGSTTQPAGMFYGEDLTNITNFLAITNLEADVEEANVYGEMKYIVSPKAKAALRNMPKSDKTTELVMQGHEIDGATVLSTSNVPANKLVFGDFSNLAIGSWGAVDLIVDPYTQASKGCVRLVINAYFDAKKLRDVAFAFGTTATA